MGRGMVLGEREGGRAAGGEVSCTSGSGCCHVLWDESLEQLLRARGTALLPG